MSYGARPPIKLSKKRRDLYLQALRDGTRRGVAARQIGMTRQALWWVMRNDPEFAAAVEDAELDANEVVEDSLYQAAQAGNVVAMQVWLYNRMPDRWKDQRNLRAEVSGPEGGPIAVEHAISSAALRAAEAAYQAALQQQAEDE